ncbi:MAG TPA: alpha/beta hydrolase [Acidimicrobiia bacterium]|nr:alpha/beta hydrolase [Acidimicrobiia bacterium]
MFRTIEGFTVNTASFGNGERTIVGVGGWIGNWELWQQPFEILSRSYRTVAYDHPGAGETVVPHEALTFDQQVDTLVDLLDDFDIDRCVLAGESNGGTTAIAAASRQPERFEALVLVDSPISDFDNEPTRQFVDALRADHEGAMRAFVDFCIPEAGAEHLKRWLLRILMRPDVETAVALLEAMSDVDLRPILPEIGIPTLVVMGELDALPNNGVAVAEETVGLLPDAQLHVVDGAGHVPTLTRPGEVAGAVEAFLAQT